jgi:hypothetical protein
MIDKLPKTGQLFFDHAYLIIDLWQFLKFEVI